MCFAYRHPWSAAMHRAPELVAVGSRAERGGSKFRASIEEYVYSQGFLVSNT